MPHTTVVWFRNDLRLRDHEALAAAARTSDRVVPVYCFDPRHYRRTRWGTAKTGALRAQFLIESVADLRKGLRALGTDLVVRLGEPEAVLPDLVQQVGAGAVHVHREVTAEEVEVERAVERALAETGIPVQSFWGHTLYHVDDIPFGRDEIPDVYTSFRKRVERRSTVRPALPRPERLAALPDDLDVGALPAVEDLGLEPRRIDVRAVLPFEGGATAGLDRMNTYIWEQDLLRHYKETRNGLLGADYSSKLSPWLAHGCLSPRTVYEQVKAYEEERVKNQSTYWFIVELIWRDFFRFAGWKAGDRLFHASGPLQREVAWKDDEAAFRRWASGTTGIPFVDANMRELNASGFMSNRGRQNVASFLAKNLRLDWRRGAAYFEARLVDYDVTSNWGNWAYVAGVGHDPRDRTFDVASQAQRYDEEGTYVKHWLPSLRDVPRTLIHEPHTMSPMEQQMYGVTIGEDYPAPMIDLEAS